MSWQVALALFFVMLVAQGLVQRSYSKSSKLPESLPPALSYILGLTPLAVIVGLLMHPHVQWSWWLGLLLFAEGVFIAFFNIFSFRALKRLPLGRYQTIYQSYEIVVIVLGWMILGEKLGGYQIAGGALLLAAAYLAIRAPEKNSPQRHGHIATSGVAMAFLAALTLGIGLVIEKAALRHMNSGAYFIFGFGSQTLALLVLVAKDINRSVLKAIRTYDLQRSAAMGALSALMGFFYIIAIVKSDNVSLIAALSAFSLPLVAFAGFLVLREREDQKLLWGAVAIGFLGLLVSALH